MIQPANPSMPPESEEHEERLARRDRTYSTSSVSPTSSMTRSESSVYAERMAPGTTGEPLCPRHPPPRGATPPRQLRGRVPPGACGAREEEKNDGRQRPPAAQDDETPPHDDRLSRHRPAPRRRTLRRGRARQLAAAATDPAIVQGWKRELEQLTAAAAAAIPQHDLDGEAEPMTSTAPRPTPVNLEPASMPTLVAGPGGVRPPTPR